MTSSSSATSHRKIAGRYRPRRHLVALALAAVGLTAFSPARALTLLSGFVVDPGVTLTASNGAVSNHADQGIKGKGVNGEIGRTEALTFDWVGGLTIVSFQIGLLYNGPEFGDVRETAKVSFYGSDDAYLGFRTLQTGLSDTAAVWSGAGSSVTNDSPAAQPGAGLWRVANPFAGAVIGKLTFEALLGPCGTGACNNQSDYIVTELLAVPEPAVAALMIAGLASVASVARRRRRD